jgi:hypothetical protein
MQYGEFMNKTEISYPAMLYAYDTPNGRQHTAQIPYLIMGETTDGKIVTEIVLPPNSSQYIYRKFSIHGISDKFMEEINSKPFIFSYDKNSETHKFLESQYMKNFGCNITEYFMREGFFDKGLYKLLNGINS